MQRKRLWVHSTHRTPLSLHPGRSLATWAAAVAGVVCIAAGVLLAVGPDGSADVGVAPTAAAVPAAAAVPNADGGTVTVAVALPDRSVSAPVVPTGTTPDGALVVPDPPTMVGWWSPGALAGATSGTTVLAGHVDSAAAGLGAFAVLRQVGVGERVELRGADGRTLAYRVVARRQLEKAELPADLFAHGGAPRLAPITCRGRVARATRPSTDNAIVHTQPEE